MRIVERGIIQEIISKHSVRVRVVSANKPEGAIGATPEDELSASVVVVQPGVFPEYKVGDVVILGFESRGYSMPVVLGLMDCAKSRQTLSNAKHTDLSVSGTTSLSENTSIGKVTGDNIKHLENLDKNIQNKFRDLDFEDSQLKISIDKETHERIEADEALSTEISIVQKASEDIKADLDYHVGEQGKGLHFDNGSQKSEVINSSLIRDKNFHIIDTGEIPTDDDINKNEKYNVGDIIIVLEPLTDAKNESK